jgi:dethiobiotin synthetase
VAGRFVAISGTDTGVGKTCVGAGLARALAARGARVLAVKPVESGCGGEVSAAEDGALLAAATGQAAPRAALVRLRAPVAPPVAADLEGVEIQLDALVERVRAYGEGADLTLVEGAGGLCSPLSWGGDLVDVARALGAPVLVVGSDRLGVVNHALLTVRALVAARLTPLGVVLSAPEAADASTGTNAATLRRVLPEKVRGRVATLPRVATADEAAAHLADVAAWLWS